MRNEFDVVVIGGGPVGLWLASELALAKVKVTVLERRVERATQSHALSIHGRTMEVFALRGLADWFLSRGQPTTAGQFGALDARLNFSEPESRFPEMFLLPQAVTEELLEVRALELGADIRRGHRVQKVTQHTDGVVIDGHNGETSFRLAARYVVGADGARSIVREAAGIAFPGDPAQHTVVLGDVVLDAPPQQGIVTVVNEAGALLIAPLGDGVHHRLAMVDRQTADTVPSIPLSLNELAAAASRIAGTDLRPRDPIWLSRFTGETRLAAHYRKGRIFIAGDAAHIHAPMGGQGMNVGIQDAMNLGWKLASVIKGNAAEALLDTYERERWPVGEALRHNAFAQVGLFAAFDPAALALRSVVEEALRAPDVNRQFADAVSGFGVAYPEPLFAAGHMWEHRQGVSGRRLCDADLILSNGLDTTLYRLLEGGRWVQLQYARDGAAVSVAGEVTVVDLAPVHDGPFAGFDALLVRPDGYLSHVRPARADSRSGETVPLLAGLHAIAARRGEGLRPEFIQVLFRAGVDPEAVRASMA